jgi:hypothetical protein
MAVPKESVAITGQIQTVWCKLDQNTTVKEEQVTSEQNVHLCGTQRLSKLSPD